MLCLPWLPDEHYPAVRPLAERAFEVRFPCSLRLLAGWSLSKLTIKLTQVGGYLEGAGSASCRLGIRVGTLEIHVNTGVMSAESSYFGISLVDGMADDVLAAVAVCRLLDGLHDVWVVRAPEKDAFGSVVDRCAVVVPVLVRRLRACLGPRVCVVETRQGSEVS